jgi:membrane-associated phospholipid phosphatase
MDTLYLETSDSFPSGHAMTAVFAYGAIAYLITWSTKNRKWHTSLYTWAALLSLLIGFSQLYLGVHYLTDVLGGWATGMIWLFYLHFGCRKPEVA